MERRNAVAPVRMQHWQPRSSNSCIPALWWNYNGIRLVFVAYDINWGCLACSSSLVFLLSRLNPDLDHSHTYIFRHATPPLYLVIKFCKTSLKVLAIINVQHFTKNIPVSEMVRSGIITAGCNNSLSVDENMPHGSYAWMQDFPRARARKTCEWEIKTQGARRLLHFQQLNSSEEIINCCGNMISINCGEYENLPITRKKNLYYVDKNIYWSVMNGRV